MRNRLTIAFVLFIALAINAQPYQSVFGPDTTKWTSVWCTIDGSSELYGGKYYFYLQI
jgi:hypothetical protein